MADCTHEVSTLSLDIRCDLTGTTADLKTFYPYIRVNCVLCGAVGTVVPEVHLDQVEWDE